MIDFKKLIAALGMAGIAVNANALVTVPVPEPGTLPLLGIAGVIAIAFIIRNRRK